MAETRIKICGITNRTDALVAERLGADALGFVFAPSKRKVSSKTAREIIKVVGPFVKTVGIFMNASLDEVNRIANYTGIDIVQLHGSETPEYCDLVERKVIKRIPVYTDDSTNILIERFKDYTGCTLLFDPGAGNGKPFDWKKLEGIELPFIIAGGLNPDNIKEVVTYLKPYAVDVSSGVEKSPGKKDIEKLKRFIKEVRQCSKQEL